MRSSEEKPALPGAQVVVTPGRRFLRGALFAAKTTLCFAAFGGICLLGFLRLQGCEREEQDRCLKESSVIPNVVQIRETDQAYHVFTQDSASPYITERYYGADWTFSFSADVPPEAPMRLELVTLYKDEMCRRSAILHVHSVHDLK